MNHSDLTVSESGVLLHGTKLDLSKKELALLRVLAADPTRVFTKAELMRTIWNLAAFGGTRTLDRCARRLRRKLNADIAGSGRTYGAKRFNIMANPKFFREGRNLVAFWKGK